MEARLSRDWRKWGVIAAVGCGLVVTTAVHRLLSEERVVLERPAPPVRISLRAAARPAAPPPAPVEVLPLRDLAPPKLPKAPPAPPREPVRPPSPPEPVPPAAPIVPRSAPLDLVQPDLAATTASAPAALPALDAPASQPVAELPPRPAEDAFVSQYNDAPNGNVVVVAMLVNDAGDVIDSKLVIASKYPLKDLGLVWAARRQKVTAMQPPLAPGEVRWVEVRLTYPEPGQQPHEGLIP